MLKGREDWIQVKEGEGLNLWRDVIFAPKTVKNEKSESDKLFGMLRSVTTQVSATSDKTLRSLICLADFS